MKNTNLHKFDNQILLIKSLKTNKFISSNENDNFLNSKNIEYTGSEQEWIFKKIKKSKNKFFILNKKSGKVMSIENKKIGSKLIQSEINFEKKQLFSLLINLGGTYTIKNSYSKLNLEINENINSEDCFIFQSNPHNLKNQRFYLLF